MTDDGSGHAEDEDVLSAFAEATPRPSAADLEQWSVKHPHLKARLLETALALHRHAVERPTPSTADEEEAAWRRHEERRIAIAAEAARAPRLADLAAAADTDLAAVCDGIGFSRRVIAGLDAGRVTPPVHPRLLTALAHALSRLEREIVAALDASFASPRVAFPRSEGTPVFSRVSYRDAVKGSDMPDERKAFWLGED